MPGNGSFDYSTDAVAFLGGKIFLPGCDPDHGCEPWIFDYDQCFVDPGKLAPGDCGCGNPDLDADASGVSDCLVPEELRARIDALVTLIDPLARPKTKAERKALRATLKTIRTRLDALLAYYDANTARFPSLQKLMRKTRKVVRRLTRAGRALKRPRTKALQALATLRQAVS